jgi:hypothetical protein
MAGSATHTLCDLTKLGAEVTGKKFLKQEDGNSHSHVRIAFGVLIYDRPDGTRLMLDEVADHDESLPSAIVVPILDCDLGKTEIGARMTVTELTSHQAQRQKALR